MRTAFAAKLAEIETHLEHALRDVPPALDLIAAADSPAAGGVSGRLDVAASRLRMEYRSIDSTLMSVAACQAPVAGDLRLVLALLEVSHHAMLIANQLRMIGGHMDELGSAHGLSDDTQRLLEQMVVLTGDQLNAAVTAFCARWPEAAAQIDAMDSSLDRLNRELFACARDLESSARRRAVAMRHVLIARSLERIGDNALGIARQAPFVLGDRGETTVPAAHVVS